MLLIIILFAPLWLTPLILISLIFSKEQRSKAFFWVYVVELIFTVSGISYLYLIQAPSGLAYLTVLFPAWGLMLVAMIMQTFFNPEIPKIEDKIRE
jgi:hypothetical protein